MMTKRGWRCPILSGFHLLVHRIHILLEQSSEKHHREETEAGVTDNQQFRTLPHQKYAFAPVPTMEIIHEIRRVWSILLGRCYLMGE
jgi:hypothetical protein